MKNSTHVSRILIRVSVLLSIPAMTVALAAQYKPPPPPPSRPSYTPPPSRPSYTPPPSRPSYTPPPSRPSYTPPPSRPSYTPPPSQPSYNPSPSRPYSPPAQGGGSGARTVNPSPSAPAHSYTPGAPSGRSTPSPQSSSGSGVTTYTPHVYTPGVYPKGEPGAPHSSGGTTVSGEGVRNSNGVTTYSPHTSTGTSYTPTTPTAPRTNTYTPAAPAATRGNSYTPATPATVGGNTYAPRNSSPRTTAGSGTHAVYNVPESAGAGKPGSGNSTLTAAGSQSVLHQVNTARTGMNGINKHSIPQGQVAVHTDKSLTVTATNGRKFNLRPDGTLASFSAHGQTASFRANGHLASVHTPAMDIAHGPRGQRTVISERPDHSRLVSTGAHSGYLQHSVAYHGHTYDQRAYVHGDHRYTREYIGYRYHGRDFDDYRPRFYYDPLFYGWAFYPWGDVGSYAWGWDDSPWFNFYAGYFAPWDTYPSGAYWLTDYFLGQTLDDGYQMDAQAVGGPDSGYAGDDTAPPDDDEAYAPADTPITPEIKQMIAEEVQQQLAYENAAAAQPDQAPTLDGLPQVLTPNHLFVVNQGLNVATTDGQQCGLSTGDVIKLVATPPEDAVSADLMVVSSRKGDCPAGLTVTVPLESLQEMQNNFRAQLDSGLQTLHAQQGQGGLPGAPYSAIAPPPRPVDEPPADNENVQSLLDAQQQQANQTERSVTQSAFASAPPAN